MYISYVNRFDADPYQCVGLNVYKCCQKNVCVRDCYKSLGVNVATQMLLAEAAVMSIFLQSPPLLPLLILLTTVSTIK